MLIGICGFASSGKGTVADYLRFKKNFVKVSFADPLKDAVSSIFRVPRYLLEGDTDESRAYRERPIPEFWQKTLKKDAPQFENTNMTWRWVLQHIGTDVMRKSFHDDIWIASAECNIQKLLDNGYSVVVPDVRFTNEAEMIRRLDGCVASVVRSSVFDEQIEKRNTLHVSETGWLNIIEDRIFYNNSTLKDLYNQVDNYIGK